MVGVSELPKLISSLKACVGGFDPSLFSGADASRLVCLFSEIERLGAAGRVLASARVAETGRWRSEGAKNPAAWVASKTGTTETQARDSLDTARRVGFLPQVDAVFRSGGLSAAQVSVVARGASVDPSAQESLLRSAGRDSLRELQMKSRRIEASGISDERKRYERVYANRSLRSWIDGSGVFNLLFQNTPDAGAKVLAALEPFRKEILNKARRSKKYEGPSVYDADALVGLASSGGGSLSKTVVNIDVDYDSFVSGKGRRCEIRGVGPIPVSRARELAQDAYLNVILTRGFESLAISRLGRYIPSRVKTAVESRDSCCVVRGCGTEQGLEKDHVVPVSANGPTSVENLVRMCSFHHSLKTHRGYRLVGTHGDWDLVGPRDLVERAPPEGELV